MQRRTFTTSLTENRKADRQKMAREIGQLIEECGATYERVEGGDYPGPQCIQLKVRTPRGLQVTVEFDGRSCQPDVHVLSWHMASDSLDTLNEATFGGNVNKCHFCKATYVAYGYEDLREQLKKGLDLAISGEAFRPREVATT